MESLQQPQPSEAGLALESKIRYVQPAPHDEVMMEQLEYLLLHSRSGPHEECAACARLERIRRCLLAPFV